MMWRAATLFLLLMLAVPGAWGSAGAQAPKRESNPDTITVVLPAFFSEPPQLGLSVTTVLYLQIWRTLRKAPERNTERLSFGPSQLWWYEAPPEEPTHEAAIAQARSDSPQLIVWGKAYALPGGSSVMPYLAIPKKGDDSRKRQFEQWKLAFSSAGKDHQIIADLPARDYSFEPIFLPRIAVTSYSSIDALAIYSRRSGGVKRWTVDEVEDLFAEQWEENAVRVRTDKGPGWLRLPNLSKTTEVIDFVGGVTRIFRADWEGALQLLARVAASAHAPTAVRIDSNLLMARAAYQLGRAFEPYLLEAEKLDRFSQRVVRYRVMGMLAGLQGAEAAQLADKAAAIRSYLEARAHLFSADDEWLRACRSLFTAVAAP